MNTHTTTIVLHDKIEMRFTVDKPIVELGRVAIFGRDAYQFTHHTLHGNEGERIEAHYSPMLVTHLTSPDSSNPSPLLDQVKQRDSQ